MDLEQRQWNTREAENSKHFASAASRKMQRNERQRNEILTRQPDTAHFVESSSGHEEAQKAQERNFCAACASLWRFRSFWLRLCRAVFARG
jgi:hypothetical protein